MGNETISVIHLIWIPYPFDLFKTFINSYKKFDSAAPHDLIILFNGVKDEALTTQYHDLLHKENIDYKSYIRSEGQDIDCYFWIAKKITSDYVLFLNSFSIVLSHNWLKKYIEPFKKSKIGLISATASNQSIYNYAFQTNKHFLGTKKGFTYNFRKYKLFVKTFLFMRVRFKPFLQTLHLRTNAFMIKRELFLLLKYKPLTTKMRAYQFESGRNSLTNQIIKKGYQVLLIDKNGKTYKPLQWKDSNTFWTRNQENLLVSDNQTAKYANGDIKEKQFLTNLAWGKK